MQPTKEIQWANFRAYSAATTLTTATATTTTQAKATAAAAPDAVAAASLAKKLISKSIIMIGGAAAFVCVDSVDCQSSRQERGESKQIWFH